MTILCLTSSLLVSSRSAVLFDVYFIRPVDFRGGVRQSRSVWIKFTKKSFYDFFNIINVYIEKKEYLYFSMYIVIVVLGYIIM